MLGALLKLGAILAALLSILIGLVFFSTAITRTGFYRWHAETYMPKLIGFTPAQHYGIPWGYTFEELYKEDLTGQKAIVTGGNSGIGYEAALAMARLGAEVTLACRNPTKCQAAAEKIGADPKTKGTVLTGTVDTSSLSSVQKFAAEYRKTHPHQALDILFLNAGTAYFVPDVPCVPLSEDGVESTFAANYLGHHLLYRSLEGMLQMSKLGRVVQTSSNASFDTYTYSVATDLKTLNGCLEPYLAGPANLSYGQSKLAQILWTKKLTRLFPSSTVFYNSFHPGYVDTGLHEKIFEQMKPSDWSPILAFLRWIQREVMWRANEGALTGLFLAVNTDRLEKETIRGKFFHPMVQEVENPLAMDEDLQDRLWDFSEDLIKDFLPTESANPPEEQESQDQSIGEESALQEDAPIDTTSTEEERAEDPPHSEEENTANVVQTEE